MTDIDDKAKAAPLRVSTHVSYWVRREEYSRL